VRPGRLPALHLDNREIIEARLTSLADLDSVLLTGPVAAYLGRAPARQDDIDRILLRSAREWGFEGAAQCSAGGRSD
jgi:hypothetical protein